MVLSGRRKNSSDINAANSKIVRQCYGEGKPVLGICYGAEIIALTLGGSIKRMPVHVSGMTSVSLLRPTKLAPARESLSVYESHAFCVARLPPGFQSIASSQYCEHEIFADEGKRIYGTQFHPEAESASASGASPGTSANRRPASSAGRTRSSRAAS